MAQMLFISKGKFQKLRELALRKFGDVEIPLLHVLKGSFMQSSTLNIFSAKFEEV
jgi:hypothetical protein